MVQKIETPGGEALAILPWDEYQALLAATEDRADLRAYDAAKAKLGSGAEEIVPAPYAERLLDGESPIRVFRELRRMSARSLAAAAGISPSYLSQLEMGKRKGTPGKLKRIAEVLEVALDDLA